MADDNDILVRIAEDRNRIERQSLDSKFAYLSINARRKSDGAGDSAPDFRSPFAHDIDRIIHSHSYARYMDKTQVFFQIKNDHITRRSLHVQMVSRIARTIGRCLNLNLDLIEAIAVGHDIGHTPFGHAGETVIAEVLQEKDAGTFVHNAQSVRVLQYLEHKGKGCDLTLPVLDGILGHNGEVEQCKYELNKNNLSWEMLEKNLEKCFSEPGYDKKVFPSTLEGCVVRVSDLISYLGKDFEDAVTLKLVDPCALPWGVRRVLGSTNHDIVNTLCSDIIKNSYGAGCIAFSDEIYDALKEMKAFNYDRIYGCPLIAKPKSKFADMVKSLFEAYLSDLDNTDEESSIFKDFISHFPDSYMKENQDERIVADFIAGMTDQYFLKQYNIRFLPISFDYDGANMIQRFGHWF